MTTLADAEAKLAELETRLAGSQVSVDALLSRLAEGDETVKGSDLMLARTSVEVLERLIPQARQQRDDAKRGDLTQRQADFRPSLSRAEVEQAQAQAELDITAALRSVRDSIDRYNYLYGELSNQASELGLVEGLTDPLGPVMVGRDGLTINDLVYVGISFDEIADIIIDAAMRGLRR